MAEGGSTVRRAPSIGARWALRNSALFALVLFGIAALAQYEVERRVTEDAKLLLELEVRELVEEVGKGALSLPEIAREVDPDVAASIDPDLEIGVQVFDERGKRLYARGRLAEFGFGVPETLAAAPAHRPAEPEHSTFSEIAVPGEAPYWVVTARADVGFVQVGISSKEFVESAGELRRLLVAASPLLAVLVGLVGWWLARQSLRPVREMVRSGRRVAFSHLGERLPTSGNGDELDRLAETFNDAFARVEEGANQLRRFTADAAHELRAPLTRVRSRLEAAVTDANASPERVRAAVASGLEDLDALAETLTATLQLAECEAGLPAGQRQPVALDAVLTEVVEFYGPLASEQALELRLELGGPVEVEGMAVWLRQAFSNLVRNALAHARRRIELRVSPREAGQVRVEVEDDGEGIPSHALPRIFDRFYRMPGRPPGGGSGLGLAIAREMLRAHGGRIEVESRPGRGTTFRAFLPVGPSAVGAAQASAVGRRASAA